MRQIAPALLALAACATSPALPAHGLNEWEEPAFISPAGVLVRLSPGAEAYLTPEMARVMEEDLLEAYAAHGVPPEKTAACILGVTALLVDRPVWLCHTRQNGQAVDIPCVGATDSRWRVRMARVGRCAYDQGRQGPPYEHELAHVVDRCVGRPVDWDHTDPIWEAITAERPCP